ncbi:hypothetical protein [Mesobacterium pallidum]|uniref:hypothetical protein n=1 Tax=Mesobacterium pallidum TaxID=2872037 RepID=UPI001EE2F101|nr:hypothetical protein [Mesobacterium pallidum]
MKQLVLAALIALPLPAAAQEEGSDLMKRGLQLFFDGLHEEMEPALRELDLLMDDFGPALRDFATEMGPALRELLAEVEDWSVYEAPEVLPNGDILIRRKPEAPPLPRRAPMIAPPEEIEL